MVLNPDSSSTSVQTSLRVRAQPIGVNYSHHNLVEEVQIMRGTHHPAIVKLVSFSESLEHYFLVLERKICFPVH